MSRDHLSGIAAMIAAVDSVVSLPSYQESVLARAPRIAQLNPGPLGVFLGFDFHLTSEGPQLIEINANAGGALLNTVLARSQQACCREMFTEFESTADLNNLEKLFFDDVLRRVASPARRGSCWGGWLSWTITPAASISIRKCGSSSACSRASAPRRSSRTRVSWFGAKDDCGYGARKVDLVYNRLTDFYLEEPDSCRATRLLRGRGSGANASSPRPCPVRRQAQPHYFEPRRHSRSAGCAR